MTLAGTAVPRLRRVILKMVGNQASYRFVFTSVLLFSCLMEPHLDHVRYFVFFFLSRLFLRSSDFSHPNLVLYSGPHKRLVIVLWCSVSDDEVSVWSVKVA